MKQDAPESDPRGGDAPVPNPQSTTDAEPGISTRGTVSAAAAMFSSRVSSIASGTLRLVALESKRAGLSLSMMLLYALAIGLLAITAWLFIVAAIAVWLIGIGLPTEWVLLGGAMLNIAVCLPLFFAIRRLSQHLSFPATRHQIASRNQANSTATAG